jgi:hypothetical protein
LQFSIFFAGEFAFLLVLTFYLQTTNFVKIASFSEEIVSKFNCHADSGKIGRRQDA